MLTAIEFIRILYPEHDRTSCSDTDTRSNGNFDFYGNRVPRCNKCALINLADQTESITGQYKARISWERIPTEKELKIQQLENELARLKNEG